jgi:putative FmdB family regulatory protein
VPIYDYTCVACGHEVEVIHSVHADGPACPKCGGQMKKALVAPAVHFKGSGWARKEGSGKSSRPGAKNSDSAAESPVGDAAAKPDPAGEHSSSATGPESGPATAPSKEPD